MSLSGVFIPLITPFKDDEVEYTSYKRLVEFYLNKGVHGFIPLGTTSESPTISDLEYEKIIKKNIEYTNDAAVPIYIGLGGNNTKKVVKNIR